ncbi:killer cell lectin-like receptor 2 [Lepus europaeus]|uniref:killer cell lectin-like receptor 2 n=1 Tax=Lepus europaeus TaxID=9983 RepID=UPI002B465FD2|nr:killer cell lectin-like receptor 2 [Lepus europaeus]
MDPEMSDQEVTYSALKFPQSSSESQNRLRPDGTRRSGKTDEKEFSVPRHLIAVILGTLCLLLSVAVVVLVTKILQLIQEKHQQQEILGNLTQMYHVVQNDDCLKKQLLANKSLEYDALKNKTLLMENALKSPFLKQNRCNAKKDTFQKSLHNPGKVHEDYWSCYGVHCYYFVLQNKSWTECEQTCQSYGSSLLKIDDEHELAFVQFHIHENIYWIGLSFNEVEWKWKWIDDGTSPGMNFRMMSLPSGRGKCAFLTSTRIEYDDCSKTYSCICKKRINCNFSTTICT